MIKKLLTIGLLFGSLISVNGQNKTEPQLLPATNKVADSETTQHAKASAVNIQDTLWYFYNKNIYRYNNSFATVKSPMAFSVQVNTEFGCSYLNPSGTSIQIFGARVLTMRQSTSPSPSIGLVVTIYTASPSGVPGASIQTATCVITGTAGMPSTIANFNPPVVATGAYFIAYKTATTIVAGDTIRPFLTIAQTATSVPNGSNVKFGESLGFIRNGGNLISTTNYYNGPSAGTDFEPIVVPIVSFNYSANVSYSSAPTPSANPGAHCANAGIVHTNLSEPIVDNRQYNYNAFHPYWAPFTSTITAPAPDPVHNWSFSGPPTPTASYNTSVTTAVVTHTYATTGNGSGSLLVKYQKGGSFASGKSADAKTWTLQIVSCGLVGVQENSIDLNLSVYPNPVVNGKTNISGLQGQNTISVYNMLGQMVNVQTTENEMATVDLTNQTQGTYVIRVTDSSNKSKVIKVIKE